MQLSPLYHESFGPPLIKGWTRVGWLLTFPIKAFTLEPSDKARVVQLSADPKYNTDLLPRSALLQGTRASISIRTHIERAEHVSRGASPPAAENFVIEATG